MSLVRASWSAFLCNATNASVNFWPAYLVKSLEILMYITFQLEVGSILLEFPEGTIIKPCIVHKGESYSYIVM